MVAITTAALSKTLSHALSATDTEVIGILIGKLKNSELLITDAIPSPHKHATNFSVSLLDEFQVTVAEKLMRERREDYIVGIYHSHPGFGCFLSDTDIMTQQRIQQMFPQAVALVIDPLQPGNVNYKFFRVTGGSAIDIPSKVSSETTHIFEETAALPPRKTLRITMSSIMEYLVVLALIFSLISLLISAVVYYKVSTTEEQSVPENARVVNSTTPTLTPSPTGTATPAPTSTSIPAQGTTTKTTPTGAQVNT